MRKSSFSHFSLIRGMFVKSGLRFSFRALEVPEPRVRNKSFSLTKRTFSSLSVGALPVLEASEQKVGWMDGLDGCLLVCYDYLSTCSANKIICKVENICSVCPCQYDISLPGHTLIKSLKTPLSRLILAENCGGTWVKSCGFMELD